MRYYASTLVDAHPIRQSQRAVIVGKTGSGKSVLASYLLSDYQYVVVLDTKHQFVVKNRRNVILKSLAELGEIDVDDPAPLIIRPEVEELSPEKLDLIADWIYRRENCTYYIDEVFDCCVDNYSPVYLRRVLKQGRSKNIRAIVTTQRPSRIPLDILSEAEHYFCFRLQLKDDRRRMSEFMGDAVLVPPAREHSYYYYNVLDDELRQYMLRI